MTTRSPQRTRRSRTSAILASATLLVVSGVALSGCGGARQAFGLERNVPDEFAVVSRAPLSLPPDYSLRPPQPGAPRPQELTTQQEAQRVVLATADRREQVAASPDAVGRSGGESVILAQAGARTADPDIRRTVDEETASLLRANESFVNSLIFWREDPPPGLIVDPQAEAQRLAANAATGAPLNEGEVPVIERRESAPLEGVFDGLFDF